MKSDDERGRILMLVCLTLASLVFAAIYYSAAWDECRKFHPAWYCAGTLHK